LNSALPLLIVDSEQLEHACSCFAGAPWLALDTEFVREETYFPGLCLIQIGDDRRCTSIDTLALGNAGLQPLLTLLTEPQSVKIFHAASQDLEIFVRLLPQGLTPLFDTQVAAALLGDGDQLGYAALIEKRIGVKLDKSLTRTNWARRPLTPPEIAYALDDVRYLAEIYPQLREALIRCNRLAWLEEDCARLADPDRYRVRPEQAWRRLKGISRLAPVSQPVAMALAAWREQIAQQRNRPRKWVLDDDALYRIAERRPQTVGQLAELRVLPPKTLERHGAALTGIVTATIGGAVAGVDDELPFTSAQKNQLKALQDRARTIAEALEIPAGLLAPRADLEALIRHGEQANVALLAGWRREVAGVQLLAEL